MREVVQLPPVVTEMNVYPEIPAGLLNCPRDPLWGFRIKYDTDLPLVELNAAWFKCWSNLRAIRAIVAKWPQKKAQTE
jgi:hypothetical protein